MVSFSEGDSAAATPAPTSNAAALPKAIPRKFDVVIPVFIRVTIVAEDDLAAEVHAVEIVRTLPERRVGLGGSVVVRLESIISPIVAGSSKS